MSEPSGAHGAVDLEQLSELARQAVERRGRIEPAWVGSFAGLISTALTGTPWAGVVVGTVAMALAAALGSSGTKRLRDAETHWEDQEALVGELGSELARQLRATVNGSTDELFGRIAEGFLWLEAQNAERHQQL